MKTTSDSSKLTSLDTDQVLLEMSTPAEAKNVAILRSSVSRVLKSLEIERGGLEDMMLAVGEACNNAVLHGYHIPSQKIFVACRLSINPKRAVTVEISNLGTKLVDILNERLFTMPSAELLGEHGRGLPLIRSLVDDVEVFANGNNTVVRLTKYLN